MADGDGRADQLRAAIDASQHGGASRLLPLVYAELRELAANRLARMPRGASLQPTDLVHEAYLKVTAGSDPAWDGRAHFFGAAATAMKDIIVDRARARNAAKRGGGLRREPIDALDSIAVDPPGLDVVAMDESLVRLAAEAPRAAKVVELRFFLAMTHAEIAEVLGVTERTVERDWRFARAWLRDELGDAFV